MIERLLNKLGYYKSSIPSGSVVSEGDILEMFGAFGSNDTFQRFLRDMCQRDIRLYFQANNDIERNQIRGAYARTNFFISLIKKANERSTGRNKGGSDKSNAR